MTVEVESVSRGSPAGYAAPGQAPRGVVGVRRCTYLATARSPWIHGTGSNGPVHWRRAAVAVAWGLGALLLVVVSLGLPPSPAGAGDNGDGHRLYCGAGLTPLTPDGRANWKGGVVLEFATGGPTCPDPIASSALPILELATLGAGPTWSLSRLGLLYATALALATALAAWAASPPPREPAARRWGPLVLLPALVPLAGPTFSRFLVSTYGEPAGLLGTCVLLLGVGVIAVTTRADRPERAIGLLMTAGGGLLAATAKSSYAPLLAVAVVVCALTALPTGRRDRIAGPVVAVAVALLAVGPISAAVAWQQRAFEVVNAHNLVFTVVLPEVGDSALAPLGLPPAAVPFAGRAYYPEIANGYPGSEVVAARPAEVRATAYRLLLTHPGAALAALGTGMASTLGAGLDYLPSVPWTPATTAPALGTTVGEQGADRAQLLAWLPAPWLPVGVALAGVVTAVATRRREDTGAALGRIAGLAAVSAVGLVVVAVLGDGYFEIAKHTWLAAYLLVVCAVAVVLAGALVVARYPRAPWDTRDTTSSSSGRASSG